VRRRATRPTYGQVTVVIVDDSRQDRLSLRCLETTLSAPQVLRRWRRRRWLAVVLRPLQHLLATEAGPVRSEDAYYGPLVVRRMGSVIWCYTARVIGTGRLSMETIRLALKHDWGFVDLAPLELQALS
jgi:hypothetical protein